MNDTQSGCWTRRIVTRRALKRVAVLLFLCAVSLTVCLCIMINMPGKSYRGPLPDLSDAQTELSAELTRDVACLAETIGDRCLISSPRSLDRAADWIESQLQELGYPVTRDEFKVFGSTCANIVAELSGMSRADEIIIIGAHYDSIARCPAANDNASGVAGTLALARKFASKPGGRTLRFVCFANEEPPFFQTDDMGSLVYARRCREKDENIIGMISLETIGYYSDEPGSQQYPWPFNLCYPDTGNFIGFVSNVRSRKFLRQVVGSFRTHATFPSEGGALPGSIQGVGWSDHWAFWQCGYPALMVTDTALFRYDHYHGAGDTPDKLDYDRMALVIDGLVPVVRELINPDATDK